MKKAFISRCQIRRSDAGVTMILVAICMVAIIAMAALSIDVITLYLARMEAQRTADTAALTAARLISVSGITGDVTTDTTSWQAICGTTGIATQAALAVASQTVENASPTVTVNYSAQGSSSGASDCSTLNAISAFAINPTVIVQVTRSGMPTLFSRIWSRNTNTVSATAMAEAFNPSNSGSIASGGSMIPVAPRCVKPWIVPNLDPLNPSTSCTNNCVNFVDTGTGQIKNSGISLNGTNANGVIGETFWLSPDCRSSGGNCTLHQHGAVQPQANYTGSSDVESKPNLLYVPGQAVNTSVAVPSAASGGSLYEQAIAGCDTSTVYACGIASGNTVDLSENPVSSGDTTNGVQALIHEGTLNAIDGQDTINDAAYPYQLLAGSSNPNSALSGNPGSPVTSSNSIVTVPIYDSTPPIQIATTGTTAVTIVGFLQVFINKVDQNGNVNVTVLNVSGCGNGTNATGTAVAGSSPVPVRLITQ